jgi:hypothetical protein
LKQIYAAYCTASGFPKPPLAKKHFAFEISILGDKRGAVAAVQPPRFFAVG